MELEKLTKAQTVLLTLLVSFVTSIATGITAVTLMNQTPPGSTYSISKVIERTVEKVVPQKTQGAVTVKTVIVKEENLIEKAVSENTSYVVNIYKPSAEEGVDSKFLTSGFIINKTGMIVTDSLSVADGVEYDVKLSNGASFSAKTVLQDEEQGIAILAMSLAEGELVNSVRLTNSDSIKLGQTAIALSGISSPSILVGVISHFRTKTRPVNIPDETKEPTTGENKDPKVEMLEYVGSFETTISKNVPSGSMLINTDGDMIGLNIVHKDDAYTIPANILKEYIVSIKQLKTESPE